MRLSAGPYFDVAVPPIPADSLVLLMTGEPFGYVVPFLARAEAECRPIRSNREGRPLGLCRLSRIR